MVSHGDEVERLVSLSHEYGPGLSSFLSMLHVGSGADTYTSSSQQIALMTIHAAKGLEFSYVFVVGCEDGILPYTLFSKSDVDPEEERRLLYVGMTRAKKMLFLTYAKKRMLYGRSLSLAMSPFLEPIQEELLMRGKSEQGKKREKDKQLTLFS
jgi:superfamily I DNA/RNA helicase